MIHPLNYFQDDGETSRLMLPLLTALADRDELDAEIRLMLLHMASLHGIENYPPAAT